MAAYLQLSAGSTGSSFSSSFLQKLSILVQSIHPDSFQLELGTADKQSPSTFRSCTRAQADIFASHRSNGSHPKPPLVPRLSLEVYRSELDEQSEMLDEEIEALMASWEHKSCTTGNWDRGHPLDLKDEYIREDPDYDETQVEQEALRDYLKEVSLPCAGATSGQEASRKCDALATLERDGCAAESEELPILLEGPSMSTGAVPELGPGQLAMLKKPCVVLRRVSVTRQLQEARGKLRSASGGFSCEEKEASSLPKKKRPWGSIDHGCQDETKKRQAFSADESSRLDVSKQKVLRRHPCIRQRSTTAQAGRGRARDSEALRVAAVQGKFSVGGKIQTGLPAAPPKQHPSGSGSAFKDHPSKSSGRSRSPGIKLYNLRHPKKVLGYVPQKEEGDSDELSSTDGSEEEWSPDSEGSAVGEEEDDGEEVEEDDGEEDDGEEVEEDDGEEVEEDDGVEVDEDDGEEEEVNEEEEKDNGDGVEEVEKLEVDTGPVRHPPTASSPPTVSARSYPCPECDRVFNNSSNMRKHLRIHTKEFPFCCHACGKSYSDPSNLAKHQLTHGGEPLHKCSHCPKAYFLKGQLDTHLRWHQGIRAFPCLDCKSSFFSQSALANHIKIHVFGRGGHRPRTLLRCTDCDKTFAGTKLLRQHQRRHKSFPCEDCGKVFTLKFKYLFHKRSHEGSGESRGANSSGAHLCQSLARDDPPLASTTQNWGTHAPKSTRPEIGAQPSPDAAAGAGHLTETSGSARAAVRTLCAGGPSVVTRPLPSLNGSGKSSASAGAMIRSKPPSMHVSARDRPPPRVAMMAGPIRNTVSIVGQSALGGPVQLLPVAYPATIKLIQPATTPFLAAPAPAGSWLVGPFTKASIAFSAEITASPAVTGSGLQPFTATPPRSKLGSAPSSGSHSNRGATNGSVMVRSLSMPPSATKVSEVPGQKMVPTLTAQKCPLCHIKYLGMHTCKASRPKPASRTGGEERGIRSVKIEENTAFVPRRPSPDLQPPPGAQGEREMMPRSIRQARSHVAYTNQAEGDESDLGGGSEDDWKPDESSEMTEEEEPPTASVKRPGLHFSSGESRGSRRAKRRRGRYMCNVCDKRFVYQRSLKQHMRLHFAFSCNHCTASFLRSEQLSWHMRSHAKGIAK